MEVVLGNWWTVVEPMRWKRVKLEPQNPQWAKGSRQHRSVACAGRCSTGTFCKAPQSPTRKSLARVQRLSCETPDPDATKIRDHGPVIALPAVRCSTRHERARCGRGAKPKTRAGIENGLGWAVDPRFAYRLPQLWYGQYCDPLLGALYYTRHRG